MCSRRLRCEWVYGGSDFYRDAVDAVVATWGGVVERSWAHASGRFPLGSVGNTFLIGGAGRLRRLPAWMDLGLGRRTVVVPGVNVYPMQPQFADNPKLAISFPGKSGEPFYGGRRRIRRRCWRRTRKIRWSAFRRIRSRGFTYGIFAGTEREVYAASVLFA